MAPSAYKNAHALLKVDRGLRRRWQDWAAYRTGRRKLFIEYYAAEIRALNQGAWAALENRVRENLPNEADIVCSARGDDPLFERHIATLPEDATVEIPAGTGRFYSPGTTPSK